MNAVSHAGIMRGAFQALPETIRSRINVSEEMIERAGNYPDLFDDPSVPPEKKRETDPQWEKYIVYPEGLPARSLHFVPAPCTEQFPRIPVYEYLLKRMMEAWKNGNFDDFVKFSGCLSHAMGDCTQPAHLGPDPNGQILRELLPVPEIPRLKDFHYHTSVEAVNGKCGPLNAPRLLGETPEEAAWKLACLAQQAVRFCRRFLIPTVEALFENDLEKAERLAQEPVTIAAQLTADALFSAVSLAEGGGGELPDEDLRTLPPVQEFHDLVYGGAIPDGNKKVPPNNAPVLPGRLLVNGVPTFLPGLGMLPHSGMNGERSCFSRWILPERTFSWFSAKVGLHAEIGTGAVEFLVLLDGKTVWSSGRMTRESGAKECRIALGEARTLTLKVADANNGKTFWDNHAYWAEPLLQRKDRI